MSKRTTESVTSPHGEQAGAAGSVIVAGGGLAGLVAALSLGRAGFNVTLYESTAGLGGKAGVRPEPDRAQGGKTFPLPSEHGPHFVASWYRTLLSLMRELGVDRRLIDYDGLRYLLPLGSADSSPRELDLAASKRALPRLIAGHRADLGETGLSWRVSLQLASMALDLLGHAERIDRADDVSLADFIASRWYGDESLAAMANDQVLRASAIPASEASLKTMARLMELWFQYPKPFLSVLDADLGTALIDPLADAVGSVARIRLDSPVAGLLREGDRVTGVRLADGQAAEAEFTVAAVPFEVLAGWVAGERPIPGLTGLPNLHNSPMASIQIIFEQRLDGVPSGVFYLSRSEPSLNAIDLHQTWRESAPAGGTALSIVLSDYDSIRDLSEEELTEVVLKELARYIPAARNATPRHVAVRTNVGEPLFINVTGTWPDRPDPAKPYGGGGLYVTGDYVQTPIDLACMEGSALGAALAAETICHQVGRAPGVTPVMPERSGRLRRLAYHAAGLALSPLTAFARLSERRRER